MQERTRITARNLELTDFKGSNGCIERFIIRTKVHKPIHLHGWSASALLENYAAMMREIREIASVYYLIGIYKMDESGLLYRMGPRESYLSPSEYPGLERGTDLQKQKARITIVLCVNAGSSDSVPVRYIGLSAEPRCFRDSRFDE